MSLIIGTLGILGPFLGVIFAFAIERLYNSYRDSQNRKKLKNNLKAELESCVGSIDRSTKGVFLPTTMWSSVVTSGDVKLLSFKERIQLASIYFEIDSQNYEVKRLKDNEIIAQTGGRGFTANGKTMPMWHWEKLSKSILENEKDLSKKLLKF